MKNLLLLLPLFWGSFLFGQQNCNCEIALKNLITKIEKEYPGFEEKTKDKIIYNSFKLQLTEQTKASADFLCFDILKKYTSFFKDGHIGIVNNKAPKTETKYADLFKIDLNKFEKTIAKTKDEKEGIWKDETYEIGIKKTKSNEYIGFIINSKSNFWKPNEIKFRLFSDGSSVYYMQDHSEKKVTYKVYEKSILSFADLGSTFVKQLPKAILNEEEIKEKIAEINHFYLKPLTSKTSIIKLPSFGYEYVDIIEHLIEKNKSLLENSENLIVDLRGNTGGTDASYYKLLPYIMTNNIRNLGVEYLSTKTLIDGLKYYITTLKDNSDNQNEIEKYEREIKILEENKGKFVNLNDKAVQIWDVKIADKSPKNIVFLTNNMVGSSAENFVMNTKQSKKVKIMGTPTYGGLDYASARYFDFGCSEYQLLLPTFRSLRLPEYPIDNIGLQPDIYLDKSVEDWVQFAVDYLEN